MKQKVLQKIQNNNKKSCGHSVDQIESDFEDDDNETYSRRNVTFGYPDYDEEQAVKVQRTKVTIVETETANAFKRNKSYDQNENNSKRKSMMERWKNAEQAAADRMYQLDK